MPLTKIQSLGITDGTIVNADINASAAITSTKLSGVANTPAFEATLGSNQTVSNDTFTKVQINTEIFDTDNCYDSTTNYRFTPTTAGKYFVYASIDIYNNTAQQQVIHGTAEIRKNGSAYKSNRDNPGSSSANANALMVYVYTVVSMNGTTDYLEFYGQGNVAANSPVFINSNNENVCIFGAYKLIGA
jgi:hypothetical protein